MALKNSKIAQANPSVQVNSSFINALFQEAQGRPATASELAKFAKYTVKDASNIILGAKNSPFYGVNTPKSNAPQTGTAPKADSYPNITAAQKIDPSIDVSNYSADQKSTLNTFLTSNILQQFKNSGVDASQLTDAELQNLAQGVVAQNSPYYTDQRALNKEGTNLNTNEAKSTLADSLAKLAWQQSNANQNATTDIAYQKAKLGQDRSSYSKEVQDRLTAAGITDPNISQDIVDSVTQAAEDKAVSLGNLQNTYKENVRTTSNDLEGKGLTNSGEAIRQLGSGAAIGNNQEGILQRNLRLGQEAANLTESRSLEAAKNKSAADTLGANYNITSLQNTQNQALADIDRAKARAQQLQDESLAKIGLQSKIDENKTAGNEAQANQTLESRQLGIYGEAGRTIPTDVWSKLTKYSG